MNEELLLAIYQNEGFESRGISFDKFKADIENPELQKAIFDNAGFAQRGKTIDQFRSDLGIGKSPAGLAKGSILDEEDLSVIETNAQKRAEDFSKKERAKQVFVPGAPNFGSVAVEKKLKQDTESATKQARREELDRVVKEAELSYQDFSPEQVYDIINPGDRASRMKNAEALRKDLERKADSEGRVNIKKIDDTFLFDIANPLPGLGNEIANLFGKKYTKSEVINAKPGELPEFPDTPAGKEKLRIAKEYMAAEEMEAARVKLGEMNEYTNFVDRHSKLSPLVEDALATMQEVARREREGTLTQAVYDASAEAENFLRDLDPETKKKILDRERTLTAIGVQYGELDKKYPAVKIINQLNEDLQFAYDEKYAKKGQWGRAMVNLGAALGEAVPRLGYGLNSTFDMIGTLIGSDGAQANMIREANEMVQRGTFRDASIQQRPIHERVGDVVYKDKAYRIGFDEEGNVTNIYNSFGNVADIDQKTAQSILKEIERKPGIFATSKKELNGSATWNAITDGFSDLIGTFMLGAGMGKVVGGAGQIATRARDFVPIVFQYSGKLTAEGIRQGLTPEQAAVYGISHGVGEGFTEQIFPMVGKFTGSNMGLTQAFKRVGAKTGSDFVRKMGRKELLTGIVGIGLEGGEEGIAELLDPIINPALNNLYGSELNTALPTREEVATSIGIGAAISVIPGIVGGMGRSRLIKSDGFVTQSLYSLLNNMEATKDIATRIATPESVELLSKLEQLQGIVAPTLAKNIPPSEKMKVIADEWNALSINQAEEGHIPTPIEDDPNFVADYLKEQEELAAQEEESIDGQQTESAANPLQDVESTTKALKVLPQEVSPDLEKTNPYWDAWRFVPNEYKGGIEGRDNTTSAVMARAYHAAKADGSNPELVAAVENLLGQGTTSTVTGEGVNQEAPDNVIIPTYSSSSTAPSSVVSDATGVERITSSNNIPVDLIGKLVDYRGTKGTLVEEEGGFYVIDSEGERTFIESGGSGLTNEELGLKEFRTVSTDFNNNKVTIDGKEYEYVDSTETKDGFNVVLKNDKGKEVIVREPNTVARIRRDRKLHQNNYNNVSDDRLGRAIENVLLAGEPAGGTEGIESGEPTEAVGGAGSVRGGGPVREVLAEERAEVSQVESDLNLLFGLVYDVVEANQLEFKDSTNKFFGEIFTINGIVGNQKELAKRFGSLFENTRFSKELKDLLGEDTIAEVKRLYRRKLSLQQKLTPTNVKKRVMEHNKAIADELRKERAAKEKAMRIRLGLEVAEEAPVKTKPTDSKRVESVELPVTTNSILEQGNDNLGDDKQPFMYTLPQVLDSVPAERREVTESLHKKEVKRALEDGLFATAVKQGRMQQSDVDAILASVQETTTEEPISLPPTPPPPVEAKPVSPRRRYTKVRGKVEPVEIKIEGEGVAMVTFEDKSTDFLPKSVLHKSEETATKAKTPKKDKPIIKGMALLGQEFPGQEIKDETIKNHRQLEPKFGLQVGDTITSKNGKTKYVVTGFTMDKVIVADNGNGYVQEVEYNPEKELVTDIRAAYDRVPSEESIPVDATPVEETTTEEEPVQETPVIETPPIPENEVVEKTIVPIEGIVEVGDEVMYLGKEFKVTKVGTNTVSLSGLTVRSIMGGVAINELEGKIVKRNINKVLGSFKKAEGPNGAQVMRANTALQFLRDNGVNQVDIKFLEKLYDKYQSSKKKDDLDNYERMLKNVIGAENVRRQQLAKNHDPNDILLETTLDKALKDVKPTLGRGQQIVLGLLKNLNTRVIVLPRKYFLNNDGYFDPKGNVIMLRDDFNESTLIHEGIHSLTAYLYNHDETFKTEFDTMFNQLKKNLSEGRWKSVNEFVTDEYGFSDPEEFLTELFSDPYFANTVGTLPATVLHPDYTGIRLLDHIINMIVRAFNLGQFGSMNVSEYWANRMRKNEAEFHKAIQYFFNERAIGDPVLASVTKDSVQVSPAATNLAPNGKPSNLTPAQYNQVRTPEFKKWFGDWENDPKNASKVLDENGEPLVVYHGSSKEFDAFKQGKFANGIYFTKDQAGAERYRRDGLAYNDPSQGFLYGVYLNVRNPLYDSNPMNVASRAKSEGFDAAMSNDGGIISVFEPNQIKSATDNIGTFDPNNPSILASLDKDSILYHGTRKSDATIEDIRNAKNRFNSEGRHYGIYTTEDFDVAKWYTGSKTLGVTIPNKGRVLQFRISENAKQLDLSNPEELLRYANEQRMFDQYDVDESLRITAQIVDNEVVEAANGTFANDLMRIAQREGYKVVIIPDYTNKNHISHVVLDPNVLEPAETELYGSLSSFFKGLFGRKVNETPDILPEEKEIIQPQIDTNRSYNREIGLKAVVNLVNKGRIPNDAATIYRAGKAAFDIQGITENDIRNVLMPNVVTAPIPEPIIEEKPNEVTTEVPIVEEKVKKTNNNVPGTDGEATPAQRVGAFKVNNAVMRDIRENVISATGGLAGFIKMSKRSLDNIVQEAVLNHISVDGTYYRQDQIVARVNAGQLISAAEQVALGHALLTLQRVQDQQTDAYLKAKENNDPRETDFWADLVVTESKILGYTKALIEAGTELGRGLGIRSKILDMALFTEQGFMQYMEKRMKRLKIDPSKMKSEDQKFIKRIAKQLYENRKKVKELKAQLKLKGDQLKRAIFDDQIEEVKKRKEAMNQARAAKNLTEAIAQLDKILIDPNC